MNFTFCSHRRVQQWLSCAKAPASLQYGFGYSMPSVPCLAVIEIRNAYNQGRVELVQRRELNGAFTYIAQMRRVPARRGEHERFSPTHLDPTRKAF